VSGSVAAPLARRDGKSTCTTRVEFDRDCRACGREHLDRRQGDSSMEYACIFLYFENGTHRIIHTHAASIRVIDLDAEPQ
jgi:hypothetical protein